MCVKEVDMRAATCKLPASLQRTRVDSGSTAIRRDERRVPPVSGPEVGLMDAIRKPCSTTMYGILDVL